MKRLLPTLLLALWPLSAFAAGELQATAPTGETLYYVLFSGAGESDAGEAWDGDSWEPFTTTRATWDIAMTEVATTGQFLGTLPAINRKIIRWHIYQDANDDATPSHADDVLLYEGSGEWSGTRFIEGADVLQFGGTAGTFSGGRPEINLSHVAGSAVNTSTAQLGVNVVNFGGAAGTFASGRPEVNTTHWSGTANAAADTAGFPKVTIKDGTGTGEINTASGLVSITATDIEFDDDALDAIGERSRDKLLAAVRASYTTAGTVGEFFTSVFTALPDAGDQIMGEDAALGSVTFTDVDQENVPTSRVFLLVRDEEDGLVAEKAKGIKVGENNTFAVDFRNDMPVGAKINVVQPPTISAGTAGGITFADLGRDKSLAKFRPTGVTAGAYSVEVEVDYDSGVTAIATIEFTVAP